MAELTWLDVLNGAEASEEERSAVIRAAWAVLDYERWFYHERNSQYQIYTGTTGEEILDALGITVRRFVILAEAATLLAEVLRGRSAGAERHLWEQQNK